MVSDNCSNKAGPHPIMTAGTVATRPGRFFLFNQNERA
jgi:hypothetical protein